MEYKEGDLIDFRRNNRVVLTLVIGKSKRGKKNILSIETNLIQLKLMQGDVLGWYLEEEINDVMKYISDRFCTPY